MVKSRQMIPQRTWKNSRIGIFAFLVAIALVLISAGSGEASAHSHAPKAMFSSQHVDSARSCPLLHHPEKAVCPLIHHNGIGNVTFFKSCGNSQGEAIPTSFSNETVVMDAFDSQLIIATQQLSFITVYYNSRLSDPLERPPKFL